MKKFKLDDKIYPRELCPEKKFNDDKCSFWNVSEKFFDTKIKIENFIALLISSWYTDKRLENWCNLFWKDLVLEVAEKNKKLLWQDLYWIVRKGNLSKKEDEILKKYNIIRWDEISDETRNLLRDEMKEVIYEIDNNIANYFIENFKKRISKITNN